MSEEHEPQEVVEPTHEPEPTQELPEGYISKEEWVEQGRDPEAWKDPDQWKQDGEKIHGVLKKKNERLEQEIAQMRQDVNQLVTHQREMSQRQIEAERTRLKKEYESQVAQIRRQKEEAAENHDVQAYHRADMMERQLGPPPEMPQQQQQQQVDPQAAAQFEQWRNNGNEWYGSDAEMTKYANKLASGAMALGEQVSLDQITQDVKARFPQKFGNQRREQPSAVAEGGLSRPRKKSYSDLPGDAKSACDRFVKKGVMSKEDYVKSYFGE